KTVRVRAVLDHTDFEKNNLDDVNCDVGKAPKAGPRLGKIWVIEPDLTQRAPFGLLDITAVGIFYAAPADEPTQYGNCCRLALQIARLERAESWKKSIIQPLVPYSGFPGVSLPQTTPGGIVAHADPFSQLLAGKSERSAQEVAMRQSHRFLIALVLSC